MKFAIGIHNHQPVGNFDSVVEEAYQLSYWPFLRAFEAHDGLKLNLHNSGPVWDFVLRKHPEYVALVKKLVAAGRLELLTGGYYEPILPIIPEPDRVGQIRKLTRFLSDELGARARGMWLAERVWEPHLPGSLAKAGVQWCITDDAHFRAAGVPEDQLDGWYLTEDLGATVGVVPINRSLRLAIPFTPAPATLRLLDELAETRRDGLVVFADDGEKFGVWPKTQEIVYGQKWLEQFFEGLVKRRSRVQTVLLSDAVASSRPRARVYLPSASYPEMQGWALPPEQGKTLDRLRGKLRFEGLAERYEGLVQGAHWRSFLARYPEANRLHKRVLDVSRRMHDDDRMTGPDALDALWRAQCNCAYWHGAFGGLYFPHLRGALYTNLLEAEMTLERHLTQGWGVIDVRDVDADGQADVVARTAFLNVFFSTVGGACFELDHKASKTNLGDTLARRPEAYHAEGGTYDAEPRDSFLDRFYEPGARLAPRPEDRGDFARGIWDVAVEPTEPLAPGVDAPLVFTLSRTGVVAGVPVQIEKIVRVARRMGRLLVKYTVRPAGEARLDARFAVELNWGMQAGHTPDERFVEVDGSKPSDRRLGATAEHAGVSTVRVSDTWRKVAASVKVSRPATLWRYPVETQSRMVTGNERLFQAVGLELGWDLALAPDGAFTVELDLNVEALP